MKNLLISAFITVIAGSLTTGCGDRAANSGQSDVEITKFPVDEVILTADRSFRGVAGEDTVYLDQYVSVTWPKAMGDAGLSTLQDTLMRYCFGDTVSTSPEQAIGRFVTDTSMLGGEDEDLAYAVEPVDSLPFGIGEMGCYFNNVMATVSELNEEMVTYKVTSAIYMGGAHPMTAITPFTYDFNNECVLTLDDILTPEGVENIMPVIISALARQYDVQSDELRKAGFFVSQLNYPGSPYIYNNVLYFHYNPYEIAPYSSGMIDVPVYPYEVEEYLRPEVRRLFDMGN